MPSGDGDVAVYRFGVRVSLQTQEAEMPDSRHEMVGPESEPDASTPVDPSSSGSVEAGAPRGDQLERWAQLLADGEVTWPTDIAEPWATELTGMVRRKLRTRLIKQIARLIAGHMTGDRRQEMPYEQDKI